MNRFPLMTAKQSRFLNNRTSISQWSRCFSVSVARLRSVSDVMKQDHRELEQCYDHITNARTNDEKTRYQNQFVWELARHSVGKELVVYPALEENVQGGKVMTDRHRLEHQKVKEMLYTFQKSKPVDAEFDSSIRDIMATLKNNIKEEEQDNLPKLEKALGSEASSVLANSFERSKKFLPTRSHPSAPDKGPLMEAIGILTAPFDKLQDMFRKFPGAESGESVPHQPRAAGEKKSDISPFK